jgi:hypothetical protein
MRQPLEQPAQLRARKEKGPVMGGLSAYLMSIQAPFRQ